MANGGSFFSTGIKSPVAPTVFTYVNITATTAKMRRMDNPFPWKWARRVRSPAKDEQQPDLVLTSVEGLPIVWFFDSIDQRFIPFIPLHAGDVEWNELSLNFSRTCGQNGTFRSMA